MIYFGPEFLKNTPLKWAVLREMFKDGQNIYYRDMLLPPENNEFANSHEESFNNFLEIMLLLIKQKLFQKGFVKFYLFTILY